jgi:hypothetical protein
MIFSVLYQSIFGAYIGGFMLSFIKSLYRRFLKIKEKFKREEKKTWIISQNYELNHAIFFMKQTGFINLLQDFIDGNQNISTGYKNELIMKEFFKNSIEEWDRFLRAPLKIDSFAL